MRTYAKEIRLEALQRARADRLDLEYGALRYSMQPVYKENS